jgi:hypothetical protein
MLRQQVEHGIGIHTDMLRDLLDTLIAEGALS